MDPEQRRYQDGYRAGMQARAASVPPTVVPATSLPRPTPPATVPATFEERAKRDLHPLDAFPRLLACAEANVPPDAADRFRFRWFGLTYLAPDKDGFRLRLRVPGGILRSFQLREVADIAREHASGSVEVNGYAGFDLATIALPDAPEALRRAEAAGLSSRGADGDNVVAVLTDPLAGINPDGFIDTMPYLTRLEQCLLQGREFADLPSSCVIVIHDRAGNNPSGDICLSAQPVSPVQDHPGPSVGFRVWLAGNGDLGTIVRPDQAVHTCIELLRVYSREADRSDRERARLHSFYGAWDSTRCLETLERQLGTKLPRSPLPITDHGQPPALPEQTDALPLPAGSVTTCPQRQHGLYAVGIVMPDGPCLSGWWEEIAHLADIFGSGRIRLTTGRAVYFPGVLDQHLKPLQETLREQFCRSRPHI